jgi:hypothetical protein
MTHDHATHNRPMTIQADRLQSNIAWTIIAAEATHIFCCVIPTVVTLISVLASFGVVAQLPVALLDLHESLHAYEIPIIGFSGMMLVLGWVLFAISRRIECAKPHCEPHETVCAPQKKSSKTILMAATLVFLANITVYTLVHVPLEGWLHDEAVAAHHHDEHHH